MLPKVLLIQQKLPHYRITLFELLNDICELSICSSDNIAKISFLAKKNLHRLKIRTIVRNIYWLSLPSRLKLKQFDLIIVEGNTRILNLGLLALLPVRKKIILYGPWMSESPLSNLLYLFYYKRFNSFLLYSEYHKQQFIDRLRLDPFRLSVAVNTLAPASFPRSVHTSAALSHTKSKFLVVGSLDSRKGLHHVIVAFYLLLLSFQPTTSLYLEFVGSGPEESSLKNLSESLGISNRVIFHGFENSPDLLEHLYSSSIAALSYSQAGLSVLQSLSYSVPYICHSDAISGGEKYNIIHGYNGFFVRSTLDLAQHMRLLVTQPELVSTLSSNASQYFATHCSPQLWQDRLDQTINAALQHQ